MNPVTLMSFRSEMQRIAYATIVDDLEKQAFLGRGARMLAAGKGGAKRAKTLASTTAGRSTVVGAIPGATGQTKKNLIKALDVPDYKPSELSDVVIDGVRVPKEAFEGGALKDFAVAAPKALQRADNALTSAAGKARDAAVVGASTNVGQKLLSMDASQLAVNLADGIGGAALEVGSTVAVPKLVGMASKGRSAAKIKGPKPGKPVPSSSTPAAPSF